MNLPRWIHKAYANLMGYFWHPCPICGRMFGGHEIGHYVIERKRSSQWVQLGRSVCKNCVKEAMKRNAKGLGHGLESG